MNTLVSKGLQVASKIGAKIVKHSPELLLGAGIVGTVTAAVVACNETPKALQIAEQAKNDLDVINNTEIDSLYSEEDRKRDVVTVYVQTAKKMIVTYAIPTGIEIVSIAALLASYGILHKRNVALTAAYEVVSSAFKEYRGRVVEKYGEEEDFHLKFGEEKIEEVKEFVDEAGKKHKKKEVTTTISGPSEYAKFFDETCYNWSKNPDINMMFLKGQEKSANFMLHSRGHIFLNEVYDMIGVPRTSAGACVGWILDNGDEYVDFGIYNIRNKDFVNGNNDSLLLDFNVTGTIYDRL